LAGNLSGIAQRDNKIEYTICNNAGKFVLWPGSGLRKSQPDKPNQKDSASSSLPHWILAAERVETTRRYLRTVAQIDERWIEPAAKHLIKRVYLEPHWNSETGYVHAFEKVSLLGIVIVPKRRINYGPIDPKTSRDIFIQSALVEGDLDTKLDFFLHNQQVIDEAKKMQDKVRHHDLLKPETFRYQFYQERIPDFVYDKRSLEKWLKDSPNDAAGIRLKLSDVCADLADTSAFPDKLQSFAIEYKYAPGETQDGLTVVVPQKELPRLEAKKLGWLVPGLLEQKLTVLLKSLPKEIRRTVVPIPDTVKQLMKIIPFGDGDLEERVCKEITRIAGRIVVRSHFNVEQIPQELQMNVRVLNDSGETIGEGRNFAAIRKQFAPVVVHSNRIAIQTDAEAFHGKHQREIRLQVIHLPNIEKLRMYAQPLPDFKFDDDVGLFLASRAVQSNIPSAVQEVTKMLSAFLEAYHEARKTLEQYKKTALGAFRDACVDVKENMQRLTHRGFLVTVPWNWLTEYPRYFKAVPLRFEKLCSGGETADRNGTAELQHYWQQYTERKELHEAACLDDTELETFRWMLEEYRVSLFAQRLGTAVKVSPQRLAKQFEKVRQ
jgi:ATP-dependent helicase HrpA